MKDAAEREAALRREVHAYLLDRYVATIATVAATVTAGKPQAKPGSPEEADWKALEVIWGPLGPPVSGEAGGTGAEAGEEAQFMDGYPHAASVFYALDGEFDLLFLSREDSRHARDIYREGRVAATVTDSDQHWREVRGVQLWGQARALGGNSRLAALTRYATRLPLLKEVARDPRAAAALKDVGVFQVHPERIAWTDNRSGLFGRQIIDLAGRPGSA